MGFNYQNQTLYKYRSLSNFKNFVDILLNNRLYASVYKDLNDPMEGQYYYFKGDLDEQVRNKLLNQKQILKICSLSSTKDNLLMWSHYADGHKGVAIGVKITDLNCEVKEMNYNGIKTIKNSDINNKSAREILCNKHEVWDYEKEVRVFVNDKSFVEVEVLEVITGKSMNENEYNLVEKLCYEINPSIKIQKIDDIINW